MPGTCIGSGDRGYSITELLFVIALIGMIAAVAVPVFPDVRVRRLEAAASEVIDALRYAQAESVRTGIPHGVRKVSGQNEFSVFRMDVTKTPPVEVHDVRHPIERRPLYALDLSTHPRTRGTSIAALFQIFGGANQEAIAFNARGEPVDGVSGRPLSARSGVVLTNGDRSVVITVAQLSGRVGRSGVTGAVAPVMVF